jgi:hypothetical protein
LPPAALSGGRTIVPDILVSGNATSDKMRSTKRFVALWGSNLFSAMRMEMRIILLAAASLMLGGCLARTAVDLVTLPVRAAGAGVDALTTSQAEADQRRGRELREAEEREGREARRREREARRAGDEARQEPEDRPQR